MTVPSIRARRRMFILAALATVAAAVAAFAVVSVFATDPEDSRRLQGANVGEARQGGSRDIVLLVNGYPITIADILEARSQAAVNLHNTKEFEREFYPGGPGDKPLYSTYVEEHGKDAVALGGLIATSAYLSAAVEAGHSVPDDELAKGVESYRARFEKIGRGKPVEVWDDSLNAFTSAVFERDGNFKEQKGYIDAVGEDGYWAEILPTKMWRESTIAYWRIAATRDLEDQRQKEKAIYDLHRAAIADIDIEVVNGDFDLRTTPEEALASIYGFLEWQHSESKNTAPDITSKTSPTPAPAP